jgi:hypothetical protein
MKTGITRIQHVAILAVALLFAFGGWAAYADDKPPHFKCYQLGEKGGALNEDVTLEDQFHEEEVQVKNPHFLCAPVKKEHCKYGEKDCKTTDADLDGWHLLCWKIAPSGPPVGERVTTEGSQFDDRRVKVQTGQLLCEPVMKKDHKKY